MSAVAGPPAPPSGPLTGGSGPHTGGSDQKPRTRAPRTSLSPEGDFLGMLEEAELRDSQIQLSLSGEEAYKTPARKAALREAVDLTPPGAPRPDAERRLSRADQARDLLGLLSRSGRAAALAAWHAPEELAKAAMEAVKRAALSLSPVKGIKKRSPSAEEAKPPKAQPAAAKAKPAQAKPKATAATAKAGGAKVTKGAGAKAKTGTGKPAATKGGAANAKGSGGAAAAGAGQEAKPKHAQSQEELMAALQGGTKGKSDEAAAVDKAAAAKGKTRTGTNDALQRHGYLTQGPIAAGAFSTIVRAKQIATGLEVAVKSFDNAKCKKDWQHLYLRNGEMGALKAVRNTERPCRWIANLIEEHVGPVSAHATVLAPPPPPPLPLPQEWQALTAFRSGGLTTASNSSSQTPTLSPAGTSATLSRIPPRTRRTRP